MKNENTLTKQQVKMAEIIEPYFFMRLISRLWNIWGLKFYEVTKNYVSLRLKYHKNILMLQCQMKKLELNMM